jgi:FixJ family two-component response regulator
VVDDDPGILRSLEYLLESADYDVRSYTSAQALLGSGALPMIDCLISDIDMPGLDGLELLKEVRIVRPELPIILITGYPDRLGRLPQQREANLRCFSKPFQGPELLEALSEAIRAGG